MTTYAFAKCESDNDEYKSSFTVYAEVEPRYQMPHRRQKKAKELEGQWQNSVLREGYADGFSNPVNINVSNSRGIRIQSIKLEYTQQQCENTRLAKRVFYCL